MDCSKYGFVKVAAAIPNIKVADCQHNAKKIIELIEIAEKQSAEIICFPELSLTGYTCGDLFFQKQLLDQAQYALQQILDSTQQTHTTVIVGMPLQYLGQLYNVAVILGEGKIYGIVPKINVPNNHEFYEKRWFVSGRHIPKHSTTTICNQSVEITTHTIFEINDYRIAVEICEDLWVAIPPSSKLAINGAEIICNLSASNEVVAKHTYRKELIKHQSAKCRVAYLYSSCGFGESTTDLVFGGNAIIADNGNIIAQGKRFSYNQQLIVSEIDIEQIRSERIQDTNFANDRIDSNPYQIKKIETTHRSHTPLSLTRSIRPHPFIPTAKHRAETCQEICSIQAIGLAKRWQHTKANHLIIGISGGLDSTLALLVCVRAADELGYERKRIIGVTMPGFGTTDRTYHNALSLMQTLGVSSREISIKPATLQHFEDIGHDPTLLDLTYENAQARERTQILMDLANKEWGLVVGTGDLSEIAMGWSTYNGDHISMYAVNSGVPKTLIKYLVEWMADTFDQDTKNILHDVIDTPVSPELLPANSDGKIAQKTEHIIGPYELHDFFLYYFVRFGFTTSKISFLAQNAFKDKYTKSTIDKWLELFIKRFFNQQFKRSCMPDGPKVGSINLSPRGDWRMPSDATSFLI